MARAMARPIPRDAPVIITSDLLMVIVGCQTGVEDGGSGEKEAARKTRDERGAKTREKTIKPLV